ncbi:MAG: hypothetical protein ACYTBZ_30445 [Planctomycetota bacterium]|jgi:hypothetical protein
MRIRIIILFSFLLVSCSGGQTADGRYREQVNGYVFIPIEPIITTNNDFEFVDTIDAIVKIDMVMTIIHGTLKHGAAFNVEYGHAPEINMDSISGIVVELSSRKARRDSVGM